MKRCFEEHTAVIIICIVVSLLLCIIGCIGDISEDGTVVGKGLLKITGDNLTNTIDTYQKQVVPNKNLLPKQPSLSSTDIQNASESYQNKILVTSDGRFNRWAILKFKELKLNPKKGEKYTFSGKIKASNLTKEGIVCTLDFRHQDNLDVASYPIKPNMKDEWQKFFVTFSVTENNHSNCVIAIGSRGIHQGTITYGFKGVEVEYQNFKLEKGTKATPYVE